MAEERTPVEPSSSGAPPGTAAVAAEEPRSEQRDSRDFPESPEVQRVNELLAQSETVDVPTLAEAVVALEPADAADTLEKLDEHEVTEVLAQMDDSAAAQALAEMQTPLAAIVIGDLVEEGNSELAGHLLELMAPDDAADLLQSVDERQREELLKSIPAPQARTLRKLAFYGEDTAGGLMTTDFIALRENMTVSEAIETIREQPMPEDMQHLLVVDREGRLVGAVSLRNLLLSRAQRHIHDIMSADVRSVSPDIDQEAVAQQFDRYDYHMLAVVDDEGRLLGIVTVDDVIDIIREEHTEDVQRSVGAGAEEAVYSTLRVKIKSRFPWLLVNLFTSTVAAVVVLQFDDLIGELAILAVLMPVIANQAGNAGQQSLAVTMRGLVLHEIREERVWPLVLREAAVGLINGLVGGVLVGGGLTLMSTFIDGASWRVGLVAGIAMMISLSIGCFTGTSMPMLMRRAGFDPATGSTIFLTMTTDTISFLTFLGIARLLSAWLLHAPM